MKNIKGKKSPKVESSKKVLQRKESNNETSSTKLPELSKSIENAFAKISLNEAMSKHIHNDFILLANRLEKDKFIHSNLKAHYLIHSSLSLVRSFKSTSDANLQKKLTKLLKINFKFLDLSGHLSPELVNIQSKILFFSHRSGENSQQTHENLIQMISILNTELILSAIAVTANFEYFLQGLSRICLFGYCPHLLEYLRKDISDEIQNNLHILHISDSSPQNDFMESQLSAMNVRIISSNIKSLHLFKDYLDKVFICACFILEDGSVASRPGCKLFAARCKAILQNSEIIACCETFKCISGVSKLNQQCLDDLGAYEAINKQNITILNTDIGIMKGWSIGSINNSDDSFENKHLQS